MKRKLGFWSIVLLAINSIIGSGIFLSPGSVVTIAGTKAPIVYSVAALFAVILSITFASAAKYVSKNGAAYAYSKVAFGDNVGFYVGITRFVATCIAWGVMATGVVKTVLSIIGVDANNFFLITLGFILLMGILLLVNLSGPKLFELINDLSTIGKLSALITIIIVGIILVFKTGENHFQEINLLTNGSGQVLIPKMTTSMFVMATVAAFYAFTGFESVASGSDDMKNPEKNLPRAIPLAIIIIAIIYIGIVVVSMVINPKAIVTTNEVVALVSVFHNTLIRNIILYGALISMFGINVAASFSAPRVLEAISREKQLSQWFNQRTAREFPLRAFLITVLLALTIPMAFKYNMTSIIILSSISRFVQFLIVPLAVIRFYYGKNVEKTLDNVKKNFFTDVVIPILALLLTIFLLMEFDWSSQFTSTNSHGIVHINIYAIISMVTGYVVLPLILFIINKKSVN